MVALNEQLAASQELQLTVEVLGMVKHSYLNSMNSLKSVVGQEVRRTNEGQDQPHCYCCCCCHRRSSVV